MSRQHFRLCCCLLGFTQRPAEVPEHVSHVFAEYSEDDIMSIENLVRFLREFQKEAYATRETAHEIISSVKRLNLIQPKGLVVEEFFHYLLSDLNTALNTEVHHDMTAPLAHYYIFTGHNSYLTGNQLSSKSSVVPIVKALQKGVRVIELDLWPNSRRDDVDVCHGGTLTSPVKLIKCLKAIKSNAFVASKYPLIITFEDHLTPDLQAKVAGMVKRTFGEMLFCPGSEMYEFPSPESLKERIMISTKPPKEYAEVHGRANERYPRPSKDEVPFSHGVFFTSLIHNQIFPSRILDHTYSLLQAQQHSQADSEEEGVDDDEDGATEISEYKSLIAIHAGKLKGSIRNLPSHDGKVTRLSMSEETLELAAKKHGKELIQFTQRNLLRVFPKGTRITSSNYNPFVGWMHGAQMVAFNMQGYAKYLWIMQGMFRANGCCGYVKKPSFLLGDGYYDEVFDPLALPIKTTLKVNIYMGEGWRQDFHFRHFDYLSPPDFYVKISIVGVASDHTKSERTQVVEDQWIPSWNGDEFEFPLRVPELALLRVEVKDYDPTGENEFGGQTCLPVSELKTGFRSVPLYDHRGDKYKSVKLLMGFEFI
ncbi:PREDICTED: phosphoinositide phospholipase C 2-like isoform X1 [Ipomoea nil]|uniref:phosphoinositide phospholipase C 2-like isoform X1 n=1 Tax=Ipomoea nil TaxID=35883 RepID=UPI000900E47B|nr:PREDICTED: phosphoinositide phospholipase C 2-like isoform X1 [Ipomoea nil]